MISKYVISNMNTENYHAFLAGQMIRYSLKKTKKQKHSNKKLWLHLKNKVTTDFCPVSVNADPPLIVILCMKKIPTRQMKPQV